MKKKTGIYLIRIAHHTYVGSASRCFYRRKHQHLSDLRLQKHGNSKMQRAFNKYHDFQFQIIEEWEPDLCIAFEQYWMNLIQPDLNILPVAGSRLGTKASVNTINKMKNRIVSEETKQKIREKRRQQVFSQDILDRRAHSIYAAFATPITCSDGQQYESLLSASLATGIPDSSISRILRGYTSYKNTKHKLNFWYTEGHSRGSRSKGDIS